MKDWNKNGSLCNDLRFKTLPAYEEFEGKKVENVF